MMDVYLILFLCKFTKNSLNFAISHYIFVILQQTTP